MPFDAAVCRQFAAAVCGFWLAVMALRLAMEVVEDSVAERTQALLLLAYYVAVTLLPYHLLLLDELQALIDKAENDEGDLVVVLLDIERFSFINETMGYEAGTELLRSIGNRLRRAMAEEREGHQAIVGRFGADEFAVLMPGVESDMDIRDLAEEIKRLVEDPFLIEGRDIFLKASIGVAWHPVHGREAALVLRCAEAALHRSIRSLDGAITYYHTEMRYRARFQFDMETEFRVAIDKGQIKAFYQPQQCIRTGELAGVEALARWIRADGTVVLPGDFIPLSEEMGMSDVLFEAILSDVCSEMAAWRDDGGWDVPISVNLSAHQLRNADLVGLVKKVLAAQGVEPVSYTHLRAHET